MRKEKETEDMKNEKGGVALLVKSLQFIFFIIY